MIDFQSIDIGRVILAVLLHFVWQATLIGMILFLIKTVVAGRHVRTHYALALVGLLAMAVTPLITFGYYVFSYDQLPGLAEAGLGAVSREAPQQYAVVSGFSATISELFLWFDSSRNLWLGIWLTGSLVLFARMMVSFVACYQLRSRTLPLTPRVQKLVDHLKRRMRMGARVSVVATENLTQAIATGILKPIVMIPASWLTEMPIASLEAVLAHELAHIKRFDLWFVFLQRCVETAFFFHPATWWISRRLTQLREASCDRTAIRVTGKKLEYAKTLAMVAAFETSGGDTMIFSTAFLGDQKMNLLRRITLILEPNCRTPVRPFASIACLAILVALGSFSYNASANSASHSLGGVQDDENEIIEVHVVTDDEDGRANKNVRRRIKSSDQDMNRIVVQLIELAKSSESGDVDQKELVVKIRKLAKRLSKTENHQKLRVRLVEPKDGKRQAKVHAMMHESGDHNAHDSDHNAIIIVNGKKLHSVDGTHASSRKGKFLVELVDGDHRGNHRVDLMMDEKHLHMKHDGPHQAHGGKGHDDVQGVHVKGVVRLNAGDLQWHDDAMIELIVDGKHSHDSSSAHSSHGDHDVRKVKSRIRFSPKHSQHDADIHAEHNVEVIVGEKDSPHSNDGPHSHSSAHRSHGEDGSVITVRIDDDGKIHKTIRRNIKGTKHGKSGSFKIHLDELKFMPKVQKSFANKFEFKKGAKSPELFELRLLKNDASTQRFEYRLVEDGDKPHAKARIHKSNDSAKPQQIRFKKRRSDSPSNSSSMLEELRNEVRALQREVKMLQNRKRSKSARGPNAKNNSKNKKRVIMRIESDDKAHSHDKHEHDGKDLT